MLVGSHVDPCDDGDLCTLGDTCSGGSCVAGGESLVCDDGLYCNGQESCSPEKGCVSGEAPTDADGFECTQEVCDEETDAIVSVPNDNLCDPAPGMLCKVGVCNVESGCGVADKPNCCGNSIVENGETCDDGNNVGDDGCSAQCEKEGTFVSLVGEPEFAAVFSGIERTFCYSNNLMNGLWVMPGNKIVTGHYSKGGYYIHSSDQGGHPEYPDVDTGNIYRRMVHMPAFSRVAITLNQQYPTGAGEIMLATIDGETGIISDRVMAQFSDGFSEKCNLISSDTEHFLCMTEGAIRWYKASESSSTLEYVKTVGLDAPIYAVFIPLFWRNLRLGWEVLLRGPNWKWQWEFQLRRIRCGWKLRRCLWRRNCQHYVRVLRLAGWTLHGARWVWKSSGRGCLQLARRTVWRRYSDLRSSFPLSPVASWV